MKIACIATSQVPSLTANSIQAMKVCHALAQNRHEVHLYLPGSGAPEAERAIERRWEHLTAQYGLSEPFKIDWLQSSPAMKRYDFAWKAVRVGKVWGAQLVYTWTAQAALMALMRGLPTVLEVHDRFTGNMGPLVFRLFRSWPGRKRILVITRALARILEQNYGGHFRGGDLVIAPNGVDLDRYTGLPEPAAARGALGLREGFSAVYSGHFYAGRGMHVLLGLAQCFPQVQFLWVGGDPQDVQAWQTRLRNASIDNVVMTGFIDQQRLPLYQAAGEVLLMPYEQEIAGSSGGNSADICSPMKMFDYLAAGRAILSSDLPVIHEVLNDANAVFCLPGELQSWQLGLETLLENPTRRLALGNQAKKDAQGYSWKSRQQTALQGLEQ